MTAEEAKNKAALELYSIERFDELSDSKMRHDALQRACEILQNHINVVIIQSYKKGRMDSHLEYGPRKADVLKIKKDIDNL